MDDGQCIITTMNSPVIHDLAPFSIGLLVRGHIAVRKIQVAPLDTRKVLDCMNA